MCLAFLETRTTMYELWQPPFVSCRGKMQDRLQEKKKHRNTVHRSAQRLAMLHRCNRSTVVRETENQDLASKIFTRKAGQQCFRHARRGGRLLEAHKEALYIT